MTTYVVRRLLLMIGTLFIVSIINFILIQLPYGDVYNALEQQLEEAGEGAAAAELRESMDRLRKLHGLDKPPMVRYFTWLGKFVQGDFGVSVINSRPVASLIGDRLLLTFIVAITALLFTWIVGIVIGVLTAVYRNTLFDHVFTFVGFIGLSVPNFLFALVLLFASVFYFNTPSVGGLFSPEYVGAPWTLGKVVDLLRKLWVPVVVIGTAGTAGTIRVMRGNLLDMLNDESVKVARAKGLQEWVVVVKYAGPRCHQSARQQLRYGVPDVDRGRDHYRDRAGPADDGSAAVPGTPVAGHESGGCAALFPCLNAPRRKSDSRCAVGVARPEDSL